VSGSRTTTRRRPASTAHRFTGRSRRRRFRGILSAFVAFLAAAAVGATIWLLGWSDVTRLESVRIEGADDALADHVFATADAPVGEQLIWVDTDAIAARVGEVPDVASVSVRRSWPRALVVTVRERIAAAAIRDSGSWWLVDRSGVQFGRADNRPPDLPVLDAPAGGDDGATRAAGVTVLTALPGQLREQVKTVSAHSAADVRIKLSTGATVRWGSPRDSATKAEVLLSLLGEDAASYDVSAPSRPAIKP
jgi:cell division protein FtsQ